MTRFRLADQERHNKRKSVRMGKGRRQLIEE